MRKYIPVSGKVFGQEEIDNAVAAAKDGWWTEGRFALSFEEKFKKFLGVNNVTLVNSGSSANLLAVATLTSKIWGERRLKPGDEFITTSVAFPTTVNPGMTYGLKPVFIDASLATLNIEVKQIEKQITSRTKLIMLAHTLGKPFDLEKILALCKKYKIWLIEDCCDALGSKYDGKMVGTFGDMATFSFYPAHQITMGEGGAVVTNNPVLQKKMRQFRDWGRDCWCPTGKDNTCNKRFDWQLGELPRGYDHKYIYSEIGFNLKLTDFQAAIGLAQLKRLPRFIKLRHRNYKVLEKYFRTCPKYFKLLQNDPREEVSYFGFPVIVEAKAPFSRTDLTTFYEENKIGTRNVFSGNILRHPAYTQNRDLIKVVGEMKNADVVMNQAFWLGVYPGIKLSDIRYVIKKTEEFLRRYK